jgi:hypothetical protein
MRAVYAVSFGLPAGTDADEVLRVAGGWFSRGRAPEEVRTSWEVGRRSYPLPDENHTLDVEVFASDEGTLWHGKWRHPHATDPDLEVISDIELGVIGETITAYLVIRVGWMEARIAQPQFEMRAPRFARDMVSAFDMRDGSHQLAAEPHVLEAGAVPDFISALLLDDERTRPVVFLSDDGRIMGPHADPERLARELAGLAHVYVSLYARPGWELQGRLGRLGCRDGGIRIWWPGFSLADRPSRHLLLTGPALRHWKGPAEPAELIFRRISTAASMNAAPPSHARLRRAGILAQIENASDTDAREFLAMALDENAQLHRRLENRADEQEEAEQQRDELELERDELADRLREAEAAAEQLKRNFAEALAHAGDDATPASETDEDEAPTEFKDVRAAVDAAVDRCPHLAFAQNAFESADDSPFENTVGVFDALIKLERLASLWARPEGIGGMDLGQKAAELGLNWKNDVGTTAKSKYDNFYSFMWNAEKRWMGPHVRLGSGHGAGNIARIYLDKYEPDDPTERRLIVGHVGRKGEDSTT